MAQLIRTHATQLFASSTLALALLACSHAPSDELVDARRAYDRAQDGPARTRRPGELRVAKNALERAEAAHDDDPGSDREKRLAEIAEHRAEVADARGEAAQAELAAQAQRQRANRAAAKLPEPEPRARVDVKRVDAEPQHEKPIDLRANSAKNVDDSLQNLMHGSVVREDERGTVIIMSGALLFPNGKDQLSDSAEQHLDQVAEALEKQPESSRFRVEGYTDSTGSDQRNKQLSTNRARAVAQRLAAEGIAADRLESVGYGEERPLATNDSDEGRAENRRVEVVIMKGAD